MMMKNKRSENYDYLLQCCFVASLEFQNVKDMPMQRAEFYAVAKCAEEKCYGELSLKVKQKRSLYYITF